MRLFPFVFDARSRAWWPGQASVTVRVLRVASQLVRGVSVIAFSDKPIDDHGNAFRRTTRPMHRAGRNRSVDPPAVRPLRARCAPAGPSGDSGRLQRRFPGAEQPSAPGCGRGCGPPPPERSCPNNPHRGVRNWSRPSDSRATLVRPQGARRPSGRLQSDSRATPEPDISRQNVSSTPRNAGPAGVVVGAHEPVSV